VKPKFIIIVFHFIILSSIAMAQDSSSTKSFAFRLKPGEDLKKEIELFVKENNIKAAGISTCVGSLSEANLRFANHPNGKILKGYFEILSLSGILSINGSHLHIAIADKKGKTIGGHLLDGNFIYTTAEIIITELSDLEFKRALDTTYGYKELVVSAHKKEQ
jgi:predicted DNA-binding protein with PD1-like motif